MYTMGKKYVFWFALATTLMIEATSCLKSSAESLDVDEALGYCHSKVELSLSQLSKDSTDYTMMPRNIALGDSEWNCRKATPEEWCSGFWPGVLWYDYECSGDEQIREQAERYTSSLEYMSQIPVYDHDLGFLVFCSCGNAYRLTKNQKYRDIILAAADSLATLYNPNVHTILSWPRNVEVLGGHNTIMDNMMNLEMLFWASKHGGNRKLYDIAIDHAVTTMKNQFRPDGTCYHVAVYNPETGVFIKGMTHQGYADSSTWARGQAWAVYGFTMVYRETHEKRFLDFACKVADAYISRLPDDHVPYWDFNDPQIPDAPRDASAAGIVASALLELQSYCDGDRKHNYMHEAESMLASLSGPNYRSPEYKASFLDHSTGHKPAGSEIDASIIYADYYYLEALSRLKKLQSAN